MTAFRAAYGNRPGGDLMMRASHKGCAAGYTLREILVRPDGMMAYVSCNTSGKVAAIDLAEWKVQSLIDAGLGADGRGRSSSAY